MLFTPAQRRILQWAALGLAVAAVVWLLGPVLTPFAIAAVLAYALHPLVEKLAANRVPRLLAVALVEIGALIVAASLKVETTNEVVEQGSNTTASDRESP